MNLDLYIVKLLQTEDCFSIRGLGGFVTRYSGAEIHPVTHKFKPPSKRIAFNTQLSTNDEKLEILIAKNEGISPEQTQKHIENYVMLIHEKLRGYGYYEVNGVGRFYYNPIREIEFDPFVNNDFLEESFGLPEILYKPVEREIMRNRPAKKKIENSEEANDKPVKNRSKIVWALLPLLVILGAGAVMYGVKDQNESIAKLFAFSSTEPSGLMPDEGSEASEEANAGESISGENISEDVVVDTTEEEFTVEVETGDSFEVGKNLVTEAGSPDNTGAGYDQPAIPTSASKRTETESRVHTPGAYSIVVGAFSKKANAEKLQKKLDCSGCNIYIAEPASGSGLYKVIVADFSNKAEAFARLSEYRIQFGDSAWVMTNK